MINKKYTYNNNSILALIVLVLSAGCASRNMSDLEQQVSNLLNLETDIVDEEVPF